MREGRVKMKILEDKIRKKILQETNNIKYVREMSRNDVAE